MIEVVRVLKVCRKTAVAARRMQLLITAGDNPQRLTSESGFAALCGVIQVPVSYGKTNRHRLNRGGDRAAKSALHIIAIGRLRTDMKTQEYVALRSLKNGSAALPLNVISRVKFLRCYVIKIA